MPYSLPVFSPTLPPIYLPEEQVAVVETEKTQEIEPEESDSSFHASDEKSDEQSVQEDFQSEFAKTSSSLARIQKNEAKTFFYSIGSCIEEEPHIAINDIATKLKGIVTRHQIWPLIEDMVSYGLLIRKAKKLEVTPLFLTTKATLQAQQAKPVSEQRATVSLAKIPEQEKYRARFLEQIEANHNYVIIGDMTRLNPELNRPQISHLLNKLVKEGLLKQVKNNKQCSWTRNTEYVTAEKPAPVAFPKRANTLPPTEKKILKIICDSPGLRSSELVDENDCSERMRSHALRALENKGFIIFERNGTFKRWYAVESEELDLQTEEKETAGPIEPIDACAELQAPEFRQRVITEITEHPYIHTSKLYAFLKCKATFKELLEQLHKMDEISSYKDVTEYRWCLKAAKPQDIDKMEFSDNHKKVLRLIKRQSAISRISITKRCRLGESVLTRMLDLLLLCKVISKKQVGPNSCFTFC